MTIYYDYTNKQILGKDRGSRLWNSRCVDQRSVILWARKKHPARGNKVSLATIDVNNTESIFHCMKYQHNRVRPKIHDSALPSTALLLRLFSRAMWRRAKYKPYVGPDLGSEDFRMESAAAFVAVYSSSGDPMLL